MLWRPRNDAGDIGWMQVVVSTPDLAFQLSIRDAVDNEWKTSLRYSSETLENRARVLFGCRAKPWLPRVLLDASSALTDGYGNLYH